MTAHRDRCRDIAMKWQVEANMRKIRAEDTLSLVQQQRDQATARAEKATAQLHGALDEQAKLIRERDEAIAFMTEAQEEATRQAVRADTAESRPLTPETIEAPTITLYRAPDPSHVRVKVEHPAFGVFGEVVHLPNTPATVAEELQRDLAAFEDTDQPHTDMARADYLAALGWTKEQP